MESKSPNVGLVTLYNPYENHLEGYMTGGIENHARYLAEALSELGVSVFLITMGDVSQPTHDERNGVDLFVLPDVGKTGVIGRSIQFILNIRYLKDILYKNDIDVLYAEGGLAAPLVFWKPKRIKTLATIIHTLDQEEIQTARDEYRRGYLFGSARTLFDYLFIRKPFRSIMLLRSDQHVFVSNCVQNEFKKYYPYLPDKPSTVIENGWPKLINNIEAGPKEIDFIYAGRIGKRKRVDFILESVDQLASRGRTPSVEIAGDGLLRKEVQRRAESMAIASNINFTGYVNEHQELLKKIARSRFFILPSSYESDPLVIKEALSLGVPCIGADIPAIRQHISHGENGFLFSDQTELTKFMEYAMDISTSEYQELQKNALATVSNSTWMDVASRYMKEVTGITCECSRNEGRKLH